MNIRIRIIACLCILSVLVSVIIFSNALEDVRHDPEYTVFSEGVAATTGVYFMENWNHKGRLYLVGGSGDVLQMTDSERLGMEWIYNIDVANDSVYALHYKPYMANGDEYKVYMIARYDDDLKLLEASDPFVLDADEETMSLDAAVDSVYITTIGNESQDASVYEIDADRLRDVSEDFKRFGAGDQPVTEEYLSSLYTPTSVVYRQCSGNQSFSDAYFNGSEIVVLMDTDIPTGKFQPDARVKAAVDRMHFNLAQQASLYSNYVAWWLGGLAIWFIVMAIIYIAIRHRNRNVYVFMVTETFYLILLAISFIFVWSHHRSDEMMSNVRYGILALRQQLDVLSPLDNAGFEDSDYYESTDYLEDVLEIRRFVVSGYNRDLFYDAFVMDKTSGVIVLDALGHSRESASFVYGGALEQIRARLKNHEMSASATFRYDDSEMVAIGLSEDDPSSRYSIVTICEPESEGVQFWSDARSVIILFVIAFILGTALIVFILYLQNLDLRAFEHSIRDVALGRSRIEVPQTLALDMTAMWNSLSEITKRMEEINYEKFRIFEAYYRFAPKKVETLMGRDSIFDVNNGDSTNVEGTLMLMNSGGEGFSEGKVRSLANIMTYMSQFEDEQEGILVSQDSSLTVLRFFFLDEFSQTTARATHFLHRNMSDESAEFVSGFLYYEPFIYGVAGIKSQSLCFITSAHMKEIEDYASWFASLKVPLVITESVQKREDAGQTRYIGFIILSSDGKRVDLYEAIDAESARLRQMKLASRDKFEETLQLFYDKEYYLARNQFSEILKECPEDSLARWYIFECERYLNGEADEDDVGELRIG